MADTITIPSPSVFLTGSPIESHSSPPKAAPTKPKQQRKRSSTAAKPKVAGDKPGDAAVANGVDKKKQTKSRNGCVTCKAKRLKCDESKPTCQQCARRNVDCGGYRKDYKWRPFGETSFVTVKPPTTSKPKEATGAASHGKSADRPTSPQKKATKADQQPEKAQHAPISPPNEPQNVSKSEIAVISPEQSPDSVEGDDVDVPQEDIFAFDESLLATAQGPSRADQAAKLAMRMSEPDEQALQASAAGSTMPMNMAAMPDNILSFGDMSFDSNVFFGSSSSTPPLMTPLNMLDQDYFPEDEQDVEEVVRRDFAKVENMPWGMGPVPMLPEFYQSSPSSLSPGSMLSMFDHFNSIPRSMDFGSDTPEALTLRYDRQTCGILSVKDGPNENPWRTMIWPLARDSPALYHAIASMTSFHTALMHPEVRIQGIDHMRTSIKELAGGIENMQFDTAIATTLALAFAESWDQHTSTGINHIKGAKVLVNQALNWHNRKAFSGGKLERLKFLTNAWVYMDVLARLTCSDDDESNDFDAALSNPFISSPFGDESHIDPLMGAASTLFPIIGRVANLVRRVRRTDRNSPTTISQAMELKKMLQEWDPPMIDEAIEDPTVEIEHSIQTAEAYRWATLLYLHQAVPEIPSEPSAELGKKVMIMLATVPLSSRTVIVHIYPLIAASCEALDEEDRDFVQQRWASMAQRMKIGIIDRCIEVVNEVWRRRDGYESMSLRRPSPLKRSGTMDIDMNANADPTFPWSDPFAHRKRRATSGNLDAFIDPNTRPKKASRPGSGNIEFEYTVRGSLHWLSVMNDWKWEVLLG